MCVCECFSTHLTSVEYQDADQTWFLHMWTSAYPQKTTKICTFVTQHSYRCSKFCTVVDLSCWLLECPTEAIRCPFLHHKLSSKANMAVHTTGLTDLVYPHQPRTSTSSIFTSKIIITSHPDSCYNNWFAEPNNFLINDQKPSQGIWSARYIHWGLKLAAVRQFAGQIGQITDSTYNVMWVSGLFMVTLCINRRMVVMAWATNVHAFYW